MFNEEENVDETISRVSEVLSQQYGDWELIVVDDGSTDRTLELANQKAQENPQVRVISYQPNFGRGRALKEGFAAVTGDIVVTLDADLSYGPEHIPLLVDSLTSDEGADIVIGSPYIKGGSMTGVALYRVAISRLGNRILGFALPGHLHTVTGIIRAYRRQVLDTLELESDGKEIHLEILSRAMAVGARVREIPAISVARKKGRSKFRLTATSVSHLLFSFFEKPSILFGIGGATMLLLGLATGIYIVVIWQEGALNPTRPLMLLMVLLIVLGVFIIFFSFIASQVATLRREIYRVQKEVLELSKRIKKPD